MNAPAGSAPGDRPALRVVGGSPTVQEIAVVTAVVAAAGTDATPGPAQQVRRGGWHDPSWLHRRPLSAGPNGWRAAAR